MTTPTPTKRGSPATRDTYGIWCRAVMSVGHGLTSRQVRTLWRTYRGRPAGEDYGMFTQTLIGRGELVAVGECLGATVYAPADVPAECKVRGRHVDDEVIDALRWCIAEAGSAPVPTSAVFARFMACGGTADETRVLRCLKHFMGVDYRATPKGAPLRVLGTLCPVADRVARWAWYIVRGGEQESERLMPMADQSRKATLSTRQAVLATFTCAEAKLGSPLSHQEWQVYLEHAHFTDIDAAAVRDRSQYKYIRGAFAQNDEEGRRPQRRVALRPIHTSWSALKITKPRYSLTQFEHTPDVLIALDTLVVLRPELELANLDNLREWWASERRRLGPRRGAELGLAIDRIICDREAMLKLALCAALPAERWEPALLKIEARAALLHQWIESGARTTWQRNDLRSVQVDPVQESVACVKEWIRRGGISSSSRSGEAIHTYPRAGMAEPSELHAMYAARMAGVPQPLPIGYIFRHARRSMPKERPGRAIEKRGAWISRDRVDAWLMLFADANAPHAWALLDEASALLGRVVRDVEWLREIAASVPAHGRELLRGLCVAQALLGAAPTDEDVMAVRSVADARAVVLATVLAALAPAPKRLRELAARWRRESFGFVAEQAWIRLRSDEALYVIEAR